MQRLITDYIPQRAPFIMIDTILEADKNTVRTSFKIKADNLFIKDGYLTEEALIENIAQAAAGTGYTAQQQEKQPPIGYIGALKNIVVSQLPVIGDTIYTHVHFQRQILNARVVEGYITLHDVEIARCELKIFIAMPLNGDS